MTLSLGCILELPGVLLNIQMTWPHARLIKSESLRLQPSINSQEVPRDANVQSTLKDSLNQGCLGGSVGWVSDFSSDHDLAVCELEPHVGFCADSSEPGACFGVCVSLFLCSSPTQARSLSLSLSLSKINKHLKNFIRFKMKDSCYEGSY